VHVMACYRMFDMTPSGARMCHECFSSFQVSLVLHTHAPVRLYTEAIGITTIHTHCRTHRRLALNISISSLLPLYKRSSRIACRFFFCIDIWYRQDDADLMKEMGHAKCSMLAPRAQQIGLENDVMSTPQTHTHI